MRHRIKHHADRPVLHWGTFTDAQMLPAAGLFTVGAGWFYAGGGGIVARTLVAALLLVPVAVMAVDNRVGGLVVDRVTAFVAWHRQPGIFEPGAGRAPAMSCASTRTTRWCSSASGSATSTSRRSSPVTARRGRPKRCTCR